MVMDPNYRTPSDRASFDMSSQSSTSKSHLIYHMYHPSLLSKCIEYIHNHRIERHLLTVSTIIKWWWEILGAMSSLVFLAGVLIVLSIVDNKPIDTWHFRVQPNALVSVLATISKAALILTVAECLGQLKWVYLSTSQQRMRSLEALDSASRGPSGALLFLITLRGRKYLAVVAALITIMAISMEPFVQQVISFSTKEMTVKTVASTLAVTQSYDHGINGMDSDALSDSSLFLRGVANGAMHGVERPPPFTCMGTECVWKNVSTLGVCTACEDATSTVDRSCGEVKQSRHHHNRLFNHTRSLHYCNFTVPGHGTLRARTKGPHHPYGTTTFNSSFTISYSQMISRSSSELGTFMALHFPRYNSAPIPKPNVTVCTFSMCAKVFSETSVVNGTYHAKRPQSVPFYDRDYDFHSGNYIYHVDTSAYPDFPGTPDYEVNHDSQNDIRINLAVLLGATNIDWYHSEFLALSRSANLSDTMKNISIALTNGLRDCSPNRTSVSGDAFTLEAYIEVRWAWMVLPCVMVIAGNALLAATITLSHQRGVPLWRNSALAALFHGMDEQDRQRINSRKLATQRGMEKESSGIRVSLRAGNEGEREIHFDFSQL